MIAPNERAALEAGRAHDFKLDDLGPGPSEHERYARALMGYV